VVENSFPTGYFIMWGISALFWGLAGLAYSDD
jgi:hypothetical protein